MKDSHANNLISEYVNYFELCVREYGGFICLLFSVQGGEFTFWIWCWQWLVYIFRKNSQLLLSVINVCIYLLIWFIILLPLAITVIFLFLKSSPSWYLIIKYTYFTLNHSFYFILTLVMSHCGDYMKILRGDVELKKFGIRRKLRVKIGDLMWRWKEDWMKKNINVNLLANVSSNNNIYSLRSQM